MSVKDKLLAEVDALQATLRQSADLAQSDFGSVRTEAVKLRRKIAEHRRALHELGERVFAHPSVQQGFRSHYSRVCSALAEHQANWPIVAIDLASPDYIRSLEKSRLAHREFFDWVRSAAV